MYLYHYTSKSALHQILDDGILFKSDEDRENTNHRYGPGVYLTSFSPENNIKELRWHMRDGCVNKKYAIKDQSYIKFHLKDLEPDVREVKPKGNRDVWLYSHNIELKKISYYYNENTSSGSEGEIYQSLDVSFSDVTEMQIMSSSSQLPQGQGKSSSFGVGTIATVTIIGAIVLSLFAYCKGFYRQ